MYRLFIFLIHLIGASQAVIEKRCFDEDLNCYAWVAENNNWCTEEDTNTAKYCEKSCQKCGKQVPPEYDLKKVPKNLQPIAFLIGKWRSEFGGKAFFPTIPKFTYGEEIVFRLCNPKMTGAAALNYTAFAWDNNNLSELHSEYGYITVEDGTRNVSMNTIMSNGFMTIENGYEEDNFIKLRMRRISRLSFSRDLPVRRLHRTWTLLDATHLEARLFMATVTHRMMEHTSIVYEKVYP